MKIKEVFEKSVEFFKHRKIDTARLDVELLLSYALKIERVQIYIRYDQPLSEAEVSICRELVRRRALGEPIAYITGEKGFFGENFYVGPGVLIPRPETEQIVDQALEFIQKIKIESPRILDLGAGTGCIGFAILKNCKTATLTSVEKSEEAFKYLLRNQQSLSLSDRSTLLCEDVRQLKFKTDAFDVIVANPPYMAKNDSLVECAVRKFEPHTALFAEDRGLLDLKEWAVVGSNFLSRPGVMLFEMGHDQGEHMLNYFNGLERFSQVEILKDLSGLDRIIKCVQ